MAGVMLICFLGGILWNLRRIVPQERYISIKARQYAYNPERIIVNRGDKVTIKLSSEDVTHGFFLEGHDIDAKVRAEYPHFWIRHPSEGEEYEKVEQFSFVANRRGKFRYRCSITCGTFHPFMQGELIVQPNFAFPISIGLSLGLVSALLIYLVRKEERR